MNDGQRRPNILWIVTDQHRADHVGFGGNGIVKTPNLDALAARGTVFDRAYVANPICMPNRCSMLTGRMPSAHGVVFNDRSLAWGANTFVRELAQSGYHTALIGKAHFQHGFSRNSKLEARKHPAVRDPYPDGWNTLEDQERYAAGPVVVDDFYGFQHVELAMGHGDMVTGHHYHWALANGADPAALLTGYPMPELPVAERRSDWWQIYKPLLDEKHYSTNFVTQQTLQFLKERAGASRSGEQPWLLQCSFPDPHHPFTPPGEWWEAYAPEDMPLPATFADPLTDAPQHLHFIRSLKPSPMWVQMFGPTPDQVRHAMAAAFGMIGMIDRGVGQILAALHQHGMADDTVVVFTSDHGDMFGDHGLMLKATMHYQGCIRVPLVIARPGQTPARTGRLASSLDIPHTLLELAGVAEFDGMQGVSLVPTLDDPAVAVRDELLVEEDFPNAIAMKRMPLKTRTLVTETHRFSTYSSGEVELYDLTGDPDELCNLASRPDHANERAALAERLVFALTRYSDIARVE